MIYTARYVSPVGGITLVERDEAITALWLDGQRYFFETTGKEYEEKATSLLEAAKTWLDKYFAGEKPEINALPLAPVGGEFRQTVWSLLQDIPYGKTVSYGSLARIAAARLGKEKMSAQAIGGAVGHNPISIIIPCHRVVGSNGSLTGYSGRIKTKIRLLELEGVDMSPFSVPRK